MFKFIKKFWKNLINTYRDIYYNEHYPYGYYICRDKVKPNYAPHKDDITIKFKDSRLYNRKMLKR